MPKLTIGYGLILILLGVGGYLGSGRASITALIPAFFGVPLLIAGVLALNPGRRMHAMHAAAALALLGAAGSVRGLLSLPALIQGTAERPQAVIAQTVMFVLSAVFVALCVRSFIAARRARG